MDRGGTFSYAFDRPALWTQADDLWLDGVFAWSWEWSYNKVSAIDLQKKQLTLRYGEVCGLADQYSSDYFFAGTCWRRSTSPASTSSTARPGCSTCCPRRPSPRPTSRSPSPCSPSRWLP